MRGYIGTPLHYIATHSQERKKIDYSKRPPTIETYRFGNSWCFVSFVDCILISSQILIDASKVAKADEISLMLVLHQTLFNVHFINEHQDVSNAPWEQGIQKGILLRDCLHHQTNEPQNHVG